MIQAKAPRLLLAGLMAFWTPLWCCCLLGSASAASARADVSTGPPACHQPAEQPAPRHNPADGAPHCPSGDQSQCDCPTAEVLAQPPAGDAVLTALQMVLPGLAMQPAPFAALADAVPTVVAPYEPQSAARNNAGDTLRALHCLLLI
jgi:hypothetical protein